MQQCTKCWISRQTCRQAGVKCPFLCTHSNLHIYRRIYEFVCMHLCVRWKDTKWKISCTFFHVLAQLNWAYVCMNELSYTASHVIHPRSLCVWCMYIVCVSVYVHICELSLWLWQNSVAPAALEAAAARI